MSNTVLANNGNQPNDTGMGFQSHIIYAAGSARYWAFYTTGAKTVGSSYSSDGVTWTGSGTTLTYSGSFTGAGDGRDMDVFYKSISGTDVVWITTGGNIGETAVARGTISGTSITWGYTAGDEGTSTGQHEPEGFTVVLDSANRPIIPTAHNSDYSVERATNVDNGSSWTSGWGAETDVIGALITNESHARVLIPYGASAKLFAFSGNGSSSTQDNGYIWRVYNGSWGTETAWGGNSTAVGFNSFGVVRVSDTDFHAVKRTGTNTYEHRRHNGNATVSAGDSIATQTSKADAGLALASDGTNVWLFTIDSAAGNAVVWTKWTSGSGWSAWATLEGTSATRDKIGVCPVQDGSGNWLVYWTEGSTNPYAIVDALLSTSAAAPVGVTTEIVRSLTYQPNPLAKVAPVASSIPLAALGSLPPSGAITTQPGLGIGVNAAATTVQTAYSIVCQAGLGVGVNAPATTLQTAQAVTAQAGLGIGVNAAATTVKTAYTVSPAAGVGIGVLTSTTVQTAYAIGASAGLGIGVLKNLDVVTAYTLGMQAGLGIGVLVNITLNGGSQITTQAGLGIGVNAPAALLKTAYAVLCNPGVGIGVTQGVTLKTTYTAGLQAGLGIGIAGNIGSMSATALVVTPGVSGERIGIDGYTGAARAPSGYTGIARTPDAYTGVKR